MHEFKPIRKVKSAFIFIDDENWSKNVKLKFKGLCKSGKPENAITNNKLGVCSCDTASRLYLHFQNPRLSNQILFISIGKRNIKNNFFFNIRVAVGNCIIYKRVGT